ncbi:doublesex- and mab-3-related transcription factor B1-like isoform X4 [Pseudorasbora parva]|uniref:doublesex- and mab-3-related transcription factor B1-like isoform X4 n=1 Tax=Pseudorasbora parva TaxID=51549 RepID=UPI00351E9066
MANITAAAPNDRITVEKTPRSPKCARCRNHGFVVQLKGHSGKCQFRQCLCWKCSLINERTKILASQRRIKSVQGPATEQTARSDRKTVSEDSPHFPGEYIITEAIPGQMYPAEMFTIPLPLHPHYPDRYMFPAVLVSLRPPAPGAFREHVGFVPLPPGALSHPLETRQENHVPQYSPYLPYPGLRDERSQHSQCHMNGEQGRSEVPPQAASVPESQAGGHQETDVVPVESLSSRNTP